MSSWTNIETSMAPPDGRAVPTRADELSPEWLTHCLRHAGTLSADARVSQIETKRVGEGRGFAGQLARVQLRYEPADTQGPQTLIAKFATDHAPTREMMGLIDAYQREVRFYRELAPELGVSTPKCYFAHFDQARGHFCLLLEDLAPASSADMELGLSFEQAKVVLEQIATLHARWWNRVDEVPWLLLPEELVRSVRDQYLTLLPSFLERFSEPNPTLARIATQLGELFSGDEMLGQATKPPLTLAHNDLHPENVFFPTAAGGRFAVIDWQSLAAARHGTSDVTRILCMGMRPETRRRHSAALLEHYHARLCALGVRGYSLRQLKRRFREESTSMVVIAVLALATLDFDVEGGRRTLATIGERVELALADARLSRLLFSFLVYLRIRRWFARLFAGSKRLGT
jgi:aminoglycoside/choline kinase family phosphotransferase